ncbi:MAG: hypothetical protein QE271_06340 [Bacteriovoracaceae bacterium]|nr:hypothetical protein [Bacteriovoracaceae bacterium]
MAGPPQYFKPENDDSKDFGVIGQADIGVLYSQNGAKKISYIKPGITANTLFLLRKSPLAFGAKIELGASTTAFGPEAAQTAFSEYMVDGALQFGVASQDKDGEGNPEVMALTCNIGIAQSSVSTNSPNGGEQKIDPDGSAVKIGFDYYFIFKGLNAKIYLDRVFNETKRSSWGLNVFVPVAKITKNGNIKVEFTTTVNQITTALGTQGNISFNPMINFADTFRIGPSINYIQMSLNNAANRTEGTCYGVRFTADLTKSR